MNYLALCLAATTSLYSTTTLAIETDPIYIGKCETTEACSLSNMRKSLTSSGSNLTTYLIKNEVSAEVIEYTSEFATSEFGQDRYIVRKKGAVTSNLATAVNDFVAMKENPNEKGLWDLGYIKIGDHNAIGPIYTNPSSPMELEKLAWNSIQMTQAIANDQQTKLSSMFSAIESVGIAGTFVFGKFVTAGVNTTIKFKNDGPTIFGVKDGPAIYVLKATKISDKLTVEPVSLILLDDEGNMALEIQFDGYNLNVAAVSGQYIGGNSSSQSAWKSAFFGVIKLEDCSQLGCKVTIVDPKPD